MMNRIIHFHAHDWKHLWWLFTRMIEGWWNGNGELLVDSLNWFVFHLTYDAVLIPPESTQKKIDEIKEIMRKDKKNA